MQLCLFVHMVEQMNLVITKNLYAKLLEGETENEIWNYDIS